MKKIKAYKSHRIHMIATSHKTRFAATSESFFLQNYYVVGTFVCFILEDFRVLAAYLLSQSSRIRHPSKKRM